MAIKTEKVKITLKADVNLYTKNRNLHLERLTKKIDDLLENNTYNFDIAGREYHFSYEK